MGAEAKRSDDKLFNGSEGKPAAAAAGTAGSDPAGKSTGAAAAAGTGTGSAAGAAAAGAAAAGSAAGAKDKEKEKSAGVAVLNAPTIEEAAKPAPKPKPKKTKKPAAKKQETIPPDQLDNLLVTVSGVIAARPGCEHWAITAKEAHSITEPLCNILAKYEVLQKVGENADAVALAAAAFTVVVPRAIVSITKAKEKKEYARTGATVQTTVKAPKTAVSVQEPNRKDGDNKDTADAPSNGTDLSDLNFLGFI